ncbi:MAG: haloacid dehalogenase [Dehalococcoidales bacterium]
MSELSDKLDIIAEVIRKDFSEKDAAREKSLPLCREAIRYCSNAIRAIHRQEFDKAKEMLQTARALLTEAEAAINTCSELRNTGFLHDAQKELAEGYATYALITGQSLPTPDEIGVDYAAYLNGLGEAIGELRRYLLDGIRKGDQSRGEELLEAMDDIYNTLVTIDFPDAITAGLRRTTDNFRGVLEKTRGDLILILQQQSLENKLEKYYERRIQH